MDWPATKQLNQKQYDGLCVEVESYFEDVRTGKLTQQSDDQTAVDGLYLCAVRFLTMCCPIIADDNEPLDPELERAIAACCHGFGQLCQIATVDDTKVVSSLKTFLYIVSKLVVGKASSPDTLTTLSQAALEVLKAVPGLDSKSQICDSIPRFYSLLWNAAITFERRPDVRRLQVYRLRVASLRLLAQLPPKRESCLEKLVLALSVFEYQTRLSSSNNSEGASKREESGKKSVNLQKSKPRNKRKKNSSLSSEGVDEAEERSGVPCVSSSVFMTLEDILKGGGEMPAVLVLKLILTLHDIFVSQKREQSMDKVRTEVVSLIEANLCSAFCDSLVHVLEPVWDMANIVGHVCEESAVVNLCEKDLKAWLTSVLTWCQQRHLRTSPVEKQCFVELFHWFAKQVKSRKIRRDFFLKADLFVQLLCVFQEGQNFFAENGGVHVEGGGEGGTPKQEQQERLTKTRFDVHRCWMSLYCKAAMENSSALQTCAEMKQLLSEAESQLAAYTSAIDMASDHPALEQSERYSVGSLCVRLGHLFYNHGQEVEAIPYYHKACRQLVLWCQADPRHLSLRAKEASLLKLHNCLSQGQLKAGRLDDAMKTIRQTMSLGTEMSEEELASLMKTWLKLKRTAVKEGGHSMNARLARCMVDEEKCSAETVCQYLELELNCILKGSRLWMEEGVLLKRLQQRSPVGQDRDVYQLLLIHFDVFYLWVFPDRQEKEDCLQRIVSTYPDVALMQTEVHLIRFFLRVKDKVDKPGVDTLEDGQAIGLPVIGAHDKMIGEEERGVLRAALACWNDGIVAKGLEEMVMEMPEFFQRMMVEMLMMVADILLACREFVLQLEILTVIRLLGEHSGWESSGLRQDVDCGVMEALAGVGAEDLPQRLIDSVTTQRLDSKEVQKGAETLQLSLVHFYLKAGMVEKAYPLLNTLRDKELKGELGSLHRGKYNRLLFQCLMTMARGVGTDDYLLPIIQNAYRVHFSVFSRAESAEGGAVRLGSQGLNSRHWVKLTELLESTLSLGSMYRHVGDFKRAKCYLKDGLMLSQKFGLLKWTTLFGVELSEVMCDLQSLQPMVNTLTSTYTSFTTLESPTTTHHHHSPPPPVPQTESKPSGLKPKSRQCGVTAEELVAECRKEYDNRWQLYRVGNKGQTDGAGSEDRFWQKMQTYTKMEEEKRIQLHKDISQLTAIILAWNASLVKHPTHCWCPVCNDAERQCLALTLAKVAMKVTHMTATADLQLEQFFRVVLKRLRTVDPSEKVTQVLRTMGMVGELEETRCRNDRLFRSVGEVCSLLVESTLHRGHLTQALAHAKAGLRAVDRLPLQSSNAWMLKSRMAYLHAVCVCCSRSSPQLQKKTDCRDAWCWLPEDLMEAQIKKQLDQLKIKVSASKKVKKTSPDGEAPCVVVSQAEKGCVDSEVDSLNHCKDSSAEASQPSGSPSGCVQTPAEQGVGSRENSQSSHSVSEKEESKKSPYELQKGGCALPDDDHREKSPADFEESSSLLADQDSAVKLSRRSEDELDGGFCFSGTDRATSPQSSTSSSFKRPALQKPTLQNCRSARPDQQTPPLSPPKAVSSESEQNSDLNGDSVELGRPTLGKVKHVTKLASQVKRKQTKTSGVLSQKDLFQEKTSVPVFTEESVVTELFPESATSKRRNLKSGARQETTASKRKAAPLQPHTPSHTVTPRTPGSLIRQTQCFTTCLSDSGDEFQPTTPKSTPRLANWKKGRSTQQSKSRQSKPSGGGLRLTDVMSSSKPGRGSAAKKTSSESGDNPPKAAASSGDEEHPSANPVPLEKTKPPARPGKKATARKQAAAARQDTSTEAQQQQSATLDVSTEVENNSDSHSHVPEGTASPVVPQEASSASRRGRRGGGGRVMPEKKDCENIGSKTRTSRRTPGKVLSPLSNNVLTTPREECRGMLQPIEEDEDDASGQLQKENKPSTQARKNRRVKTATEIPQLITGRKTTRKGGAQHKDAAKPVDAPSRNRRAASTRSSQKSSTEDIVLERETVRGVDDPSELDAPKDIFDFEESDGETQPSQSAAKKGRKGRQTKIPTAKKDYSSKQVGGRTASAKATNKPSALTSKRKTQPYSYTAASLLGKKSGRAPEAVPKCTNQPTDSKQRSVLSQPDSKKRSLTSTVTTDLTSIETLRKGDSTSVMTVKEKEDFVCDPAVGKSVFGWKGDTTASGLAEQNIWHLEGLLSRFQRGEKCDDDGTDSLVTGTLDSEDDSVDKIQANLSETLFQIQHFPHVTTFSECSKLVAHIKLDRGEDPWEIAALLSESAAVSLRHQFLAYYHKHVRAVEMEGGEKAGSDASDLRSNIQDLLFPWDLHKYRQVVQDIPHGWTVCQFSVVDSPGSPTLLLTRMTSDQEPLTVELPHFFDEKGQSIYFGFKDTLKVNDEVQKIKDNVLWWRHRATLEVKLSNLLEGMEKHWLGAWRGMLAGQTSNGRYNDAVTAAARTLVTLLHSHLGCRWSVRKAQQALELMQHTKDISTILSHMLKRDDITHNPQLLDAINTKVISALPKVAEADLPVILILDKHLTNLPIELLNVMKNQAVTRVPSLSLFHHLLKRHGALARGGMGKGKEGPRKGGSTAENSESLMGRGVDPTSVFYLMNPDGDLVKSQKYLEPLFQSKEKWQGMAGVVPSKEQYEQALTQYDLFVYCGHGNGCKYFSVEDLLKTRCRAVPLLFGCASVRLDALPNLDAEGYFYSYLLAGSPCVLGNLWDVTDRDIDTFGVEIFNLWLKDDNSNSNPKPWLASLVQQARSVCRMQLLNGGAPVLYGLPVPLLRPSR